MDAKHLVSLTVVRHFDATDEQIYDAWLDPETAGQWLFATPQGHMVRCEIDAQEGGKFLFVDRRGSEDVEHVGEYLELSRPDHICFTFGVPQYSNEVSRVSVDIFPEKTGGCKVMLLHDDVLADYQHKTQEGWTNILNNLAKNLEKRR